MSKIRKIVTILLTVLLFAVCFLAFACGGKTYSITYDVVGGELPANAIREYSVSDKDINLPTPTKDGYVFTGWNNGSDSITFIAAGTKGDLNLTATWQIEIYSITYSVADGTLPTDAKSEYSLSAQDISLPTPTRTGYTFTGWDNGTDVIAVIVAGTKGNLNLTATWQANSYTITFNYGEGSGTETTMGVTYGTQVTDLPMATPPAGKMFMGWKKQDNSLFNNGDQYLFDSDIALTASFVAARFTVTIGNSTRASGTAWKDDSTGSKIVYVTYGDKLNIPAIKWDDFSEMQKNNEQYYFKGWFYRDKNNVERQFNSNVAFTLENLNVNTYNITIYAKVEAQWAGPF